MPLYEYLCGSCGHRFERIRKFSDPPLRECPSCGGVVEKQISSPAIQFKGSGFYITDYAKSGGKSESTTESKSDSKTDSASSTKSGDTSSSSESKSSGESKSEKSSSADSAAKPAAPAATDKK